MSKKRQKVLISWSGGKNSSICFFELKSPGYEVSGLLSTFCQPEKKVQFHEIPEKLIELQANSLGTRLVKQFVPKNCSNEEYETKTTELLQAEIKDRGIEAIVFGDTGLEDVRAYREALCSQIGLKAVFPLWDWKENFVNQAFVGLGHQAIVHSIQKNVLPPAFLGRAFNASFVEDLPGRVSPSGQNGEFHVFVFDGPFFQEKIPFMNAGRYEKDGYEYIDLQLNGASFPGHNRIN